MNLAGRRPRRAPERGPEPVPTGTQVVHAEAVRVRRGERDVLRGVDLRVAAGEVVALVGPNGAGKSTLLAALTGDLRTTGGSIEMFGRALEDWPSVELAQRRAVLPQQVTMSFPFSVHEVVTMGRAPWARTTENRLDDPLIDGAIAAVDLVPMAHRPFPSLSGGERARAALARVLAQHAQLLLLDEPTAALDLHHQELVFELVTRHARAGGAVVTVVHDLGLAAAFADRIVLLDRGCVAADGPPDEVLTPEVLGEVYRHEIDVVTHPLDGSLLVLPRRSADHRTNQL